MPEFLVCADFPAALLLQPGRKICGYQLNTHLQGEYLDISSKCIVTGINAEISNITVKKVFYKKIGNSYYFIAQLTCSVSSRGFIKITLPLNISTELRAVAGGHAGEATAGYFQDNALLMHVNEGTSGNFYVSAFL